MENSLWFQQLKAFSDNADYEIEYENYEKQKIIIQNKLKQYFDELEPLNNSIKESINILNTMMMQYEKTYNDINSQFQFKLLNKNSLLTFDGVVRILDEYSSFK